MIPVFLLFALSTVHADIKYTGFALTFAKKNIPSFYWNIYKTAIDGDFSGRTFQPITAFSLGGLLRLDLYEIKAGPVKFAAQPISSAAFASRSVTVDHRDNTQVFEVNVTFGYNLVLGCFPSDGEATLSLSYKSVKMVHTFGETDSRAESTLEMKMEVKRIVGLNTFGLARKWIMLVFAEGDGKKIVDGVKSSLEGGVTKAFKGFYHVKPFPNTEAAMNMTLNNRLVEFEEYPEKYLTMAYNTRISIENRPYSKSLIRQHTLDWDDETIHELVICMGVNMVPAMAEVRVKQRDYLVVIRPSDINITGTLQEFYTIMPKLEERVEPNQGVTIGCEGNKNSEIVYLNVHDSYDVQIPISCIFNTKNTGREILSVDFTARWSLSYELTPNRTYTVIEPKLVDTEIKSLKFKVVDSLAPVEDFALLRKIVYAINSWFKGSNLFSEKLHLRIATNRKTFIFDTDEAICVGYPS